MSSHLLQQLSTRVSCRHGSDLFAKGHSPLLHPEYKRRKKKTQNMSSITCFHSIIWNKLFFNSQELSKSACTADAQVCNHSCEEFTLHSPNKRLEQITVKVTLSACTPQGHGVILSSITCSNSTNPPCEYRQGEAIEARKEAGCDRWPKL